MSFHKNMSEENDSDIEYDHEPYSKPDLLERFKLLERSRFSEFINECRGDKQIKDMSRDELEIMYNNIIRKIEEKNKKEEDANIRAMNILSEKLKSYNC